MFCQTCQWNRLHIKIWRPHADRQGKIALWIGALSIVWKAKCSNNSTTPKRWCFGGQQLHQVKDDTRSNEINILVHNILRIFTSVSTSGVVPVPVRTADTAAELLIVIFHVMLTLFFGVPIPLFKMDLSPLLKYYYYYYNMETISILLFLINYYCP